MLTHAPVFWKCTGVQTLWMEVKDEVLTLIRYDLESSPLRCTSAAEVNSVKGNAELTGILLNVAILTLWICKDER